MPGMKLYIILVLAVCVSAFTAPARADLGADPGALNAITGRVSFVVIGDNRSGDEVYSKLIKLAMEKKPDFMINTGDEIRHDGSLAEWTKFLKLSEPVNVPYFLVAGNHDVDDQASEKTYRDELRLPGNGLYYSFTAGNSLFVVLDSVLVGQDKRITGRQYEWLKKILGNSKAVHKFIFLHHPLYPEKGVGFHYGGSLDRHPADRDRLQALFVKNRVTAVFAGHEHLYLRQTVDGIIHVITGGGGAPLYAGDWEGGFHHFVDVTVDGDEVSFAVFDQSGKIRDSFQIGGNEGRGTQAGPAQAADRSEFRSMSAPMTTSRLSVMSPAKGPYSCFP